MARPIDSDALQELCNRRIQDTWNSGTAPVSWAEAYADFKDDIDSIPTLTPPNEWVSVEDELPARDGIYLVYTTRGSVTTAHFYAEKIFRDDYKRKASWQGNRNVTHWTPLPAPPDRPPRRERRTHELRLDMVPALRDLNDPDAEDEYDLDRLAVMCNQRMSMRDEVSQRFSLTAKIPLNRLRELVELYNNVPHICDYCIGCEIEPTDGHGCDEYDNFVFSARRIVAALKAREQDGNTE